jgi:hypothetical protein
VIPLEQLEAEEEVLELVEQEAKELSEESQPEHKEENDKKSKTIKFALIPGEPDPINEPEIEAAELEELLAPVTPAEGSANKSPVNFHNESVPKKETLTSEEVVSLDIDGQSEGEIAEPKPEERRSNGQREKSDLLLNYFRQVNTAQPKGTKKKNPKKNKNRALLIILSTSFITGVLIVALGWLIYAGVNTNKPATALKKAEQAATFSHLKPTYLPYGYALSASTAGQAESITYSYSYAPDSKNTLNVKGEKTSLNNNNLKQEVIDPKGQEFLTKSYKGTEIWFVGDNSAYLIKGNVLYSIEANQRLAQIELTQIALGLR